MAESKEVRAHETRIEIDWTVKDVWKALTEAKEIERWFAPKMTVEPHVGGTALADWGPNIEWKTTVEVWETNRHLRLVETRDRILGPDGQALEPCRLVQDYYLEAEGGKTVLRFSALRLWNIPRLGYRVRGHQRRLGFLFPAAQACPGAPSERLGPQFPYDRCVLWDRSYPGDTQGSGNDAAAV